MLVSIQDRPSFAFAHIEGTLGDGTLGVDSNDPNTTDPGTRAVRMTAQATTISGGASSGTLINVVDGTSLVLQCWIYDDVRARWFKFTSGAAQQVTCTANVLATTALGGATYGAKIFYQIITNNGSVSQFYWIFR